MPLPERRPGAAVSLLVAGTADALERRLTPQPERVIHSDPVAHARDVLGVEPWSIQREVMRAVAEGKGEGRCAVPACHGPGKTALAAWVGAWWLDGAPPGERALVTAAPRRPLQPAIYPSERRMSQTACREIRARRAISVTGTLSRPARRIASRSSPDAASSSVRALWRRSPSRSRSARTSGSSCTVRQSVEGLTSSA